MAARKTTSKCTVSSLGNLKQISKIPKEDEQAMDGKESKSMTDNNYISNEDELFENLNIPDYEHLTPDNVMPFFSMIHNNSDPEVEKKALDQYPSYAGAVKEVASDYKSLLEEIISDNKDSVQNDYDACKMILSQLSKLLEQDDLSFDQKKWVVEQMLIIEGRMNKKDTENKKHNILFIGIISTAIVAVVSGLLVALRGNSETYLPYLDVNDADRDGDSDEEEDTDDEKFSE